MLLDVVLLVAKSVGYGQDETTAADLFSVLAEICLLHNHITLVALMNSISLITFVR